METKDNPKKPWKAVAAVVSAIAASLIVTNATELGSLGVGICTAIVAGLAVFFVPNPKVTA